jgi:hypothetical protein
MYVNLTPDYIVQRGDRIRRLKKSHLSWHFGTGVSWGLIEHTLADVGKHLATLEQFADGEQVFIERPERSEYEKLVVEQRALSGIGLPYRELKDNCEHDSSYAQTGVATSPTTGAVIVTGLVAAVVIACKLTDSSGR